MPIPRIIHQVWFKFPNGSATPPPEYDEMRRSWAKQHPGWQLKLWSSTTALKFLKQHYPASVAVYEQYDKEIFRVDAIRYFLLHHFGGFYVDVDTTSLSSLEPLREQPLVLVKDITPFLGLNNGFMGAEPGHPLFLNCINNLSKAAGFKSPIQATGPMFLTYNRFTTKDKRGLILSVKAAGQYFHHYHHSSWTSNGKWIKALIHPERRKFVQRADVPEWIAKRTSGWAQ